MFALLSDGRLGRELGGGASDCGTLPLRPPGCAPESDWRMASSKLDMVPVKMWLAQKNG